MDSDKGRRQLLLTIEGVALATFIGSLFLLGARQQSGAGFHPGWLAIPAIASLALILSLLGLMYLRWLSSVGNPSPPRQHKQLWGMLAAILLFVWLLAVIQSWNHLPVAG